MRKPVLGLFLLLGLLAAVGAPDAQQSDPAVAGAQPQVTFRAEANYVEVDALVTDAQGQPVADLTQADFEVHEDGRRQEIRVFFPVAIPITRSIAPSGAGLPEPDVRTNGQGFEGRLFVIVLDDLHTQVTRSPWVREAAKRFIQQHLGPGDLAALVVTSGRADASQELTSSKGLLVAAADKFMGRRLPSSTFERMNDYYRQRETRSDEGANREINPRDPLLFDRAYQARMALETVQHVATWLGTVRGRRKGIVLISEGIDYDIHNVFENRDASMVMDRVRDAIGAATRANANIYAVDPRGLDAVGADLMELGAPVNEGPLTLGPTSLMNEVRLAQDSLRVLADETGGFAALNSNDFGAAYERIIRENSTYYLLGYQPTNDRRDGRFRKVEVRVKRPGVTVQARRGYVAPRGRAPETRVAASEGTSAELAELLNAPIAQVGLGLSAAVTPFLGQTAEKASVLVAVEIDGRALKFTERGGLHEDSLELSFIAVDARGKVSAGDRQTINLRLRPESHAVVSRSAFRMLSRIEVPPGRYQVRIAARESGGGLAGSVFHDVEVPNFGADPLSMSGLVVSGTAAAKIPTAKPDPVLREIIEAPAATGRSFASTDTLLAYVEIYDTRKAPTSDTLDVVTTVVSEGGRVVFRSEEPRESTVSAGTPRTIGHPVQIPLQDATPGVHVLTIEARSRTGENLVVSRAIPIRITGP